MILLSGIGLLAAMVPVGVQKMTEMTRQGLTLSFPLDFHEGMSIEQVYSVVMHAGITVVTLSLPVVVGILMMGSAASLLQTGLLWRANAVQPDVERISPIKGLSRLFSLRSVMELVKGLLKIAIVTGIGLWVARYDVLQIPGLIGFDLGTVLQVTGRSFVESGIDRRAGRSRFWPGSTTSTSAMSGNEACGCRRTRSRRNTRPRKAIRLLKVEYGPFSGR